MAWSPLRSAPGGATLDDTFAPARFSSSQPGDRLVERLHLRVLLGVLQQQLVALGLEARDLAVDRAALGRAHQAEGRLLALQLPLEFVAPVLQLAEELLHLPQRAHLRLEPLVIVAAGARHQPDVLLLEDRQPLLGLRELLLVLLDLRLQEALRDAGVRALQAEAVFHEGVEQRAHDLVRHLRIVVLERHHEGVLRAGPGRTAQLDAARQRVDDCLLLAARLRVQHQVGLLRHLLEIRAAQHHGLHHRHLAASRRD